MSKRIITNGIYNKITCADCKCEFSFDKEDIITKADGTTKVVTCPQCEKENTPKIKVQGAK
jgi:NAD-dependent SIR2 family protein deacetylase